MPLRQAIQDRRAPPIDHTTERKQRNEHHQPFALTQFPPLDALIVSASLTRVCNGEVVVSATPRGHRTPCPRLLCSIAGPPDDGDPRPNSGTITGLTPAEARELAALLLDAAGLKRFLA